MAEERLSSSERPINNGDWNMVENWLFGGSHQGEHPQQILERQYREGTRDGDDLLFTPPNVRDYPEQREEVNRVREQNPLKGKVLNFLGMPFLELHYDDRLSAAFSYPPVGENGQTDDKWPIQITDATHNPFPFDVSEDQQALVIKGKTCPVYGSYAQFFQYEKHPETGQVLFARKPLPGNVKKQ